LRSSARTVERKLNDLAFADDIALLETDAERAQKQIETLATNARLTGLEINVAKTEQLRLNLKAEINPQPNNKIDSQEIEIVDNFKYLGSNLSSSEKDITCRIALAWAAFSKLKAVLVSNRCQKLRLRIFDAACVSILLYGCETWVISQSISEKLDIFARKAYRIMLKINQQEDKISNEELYRMTGQRPINQIIRERQLQFVGHCLRMPEDELSKIYIMHQSKLNEIKPVGKPRTTQYDQIASYLSKDKMVKPTLDEMTKWAKNRSDWKLLVAAPKKPAR
jgi:hypothetical protein